MSDPASRIPTIGPFLEVSGYQLSGGDALYLGIYHGTCMALATCAVVTDIDDVCVFDRALTAEIRALYTNET
jgi:hypothetical protein